MGLHSIHASDHNRGTVIYVTRIYSYRGFNEKPGDFMPSTERLLLTRDQELYLEWLVLPEHERVPLTKKEWAEQHGYHANTLGTWEKKKHFIERWKLGVEGLAQSPDRTQKLLDALYNKGLDGDTKSAELYLKATGNLKIQSQVDIRNTTSIKDVSDEELEKMILELSQKHADVVELKKAQ